MGLLLFSAAVALESIPSIRDQWDLVFFEEVRKDPGILELVESSVAERPQMPFRSL